jgi:hypothetical protein
LDAMLSPAMGSQLDSKVKKMVDLADKDVPREWLHRLRQLESFAHERVGTIFHKYSIEITECNDNFRKASQQLEKIEHDLDKEKDIIHRTKKSLETKNNDNLEAKEKYAKVRLTGHARELQECEAHLRISDVEIKELEAKLNRLERSLQNLEVQVRHKASFHDRARKDLIDARSRRQTELQKERDDINREVMDELSKFKSQDYLQRKISMKDRARKIHFERQIQVVKNRVMLNKNRENRNLKLFKAKERGNKDEIVSEKKSIHNNDIGSAKAPDIEKQNELKKARLAKQIAAFHKIQETEKSNLKAFTEKANREKEKEFCRRAQSSLAWNCGQPQMVPERPERPPLRASTATPSARSRKNRTDFLENFLNQRPSGKYNRVWTVPKEEIPLFADNVVPRADIILPRC